MANFVRQVTSWGEEHGLINTLTNSCEFDDFAKFKPEHKAEMQRLKKEDAKLVKVEYVHKGGKHERLTKPYCRYAGDPILIFHLIPGKVYELPLGFVKEVNEKKSVKRSGLLSLDGEKVTKDGSPLERDEEGDWIHRLVKADTF